MHRQPGRNCPTTLWLRPAISAGRGPNLRFQSSNALHRNGKLTALTSNAKFQFYGIGSTLSPSLSLASMLPVGLFPACTGPDCIWRNGHSSTDKDYLRHSQRALGFRIRQHAERGEARDQAPSRRSDCSLRCRSTVSLDHRKRLAARCMARADKRPGTDSAPCRSPTQRVD